MKHYLPDQAWWLVKDEYTKETVPSTLVGFQLPLEVCLLIGDPWQAPRSEYAQRLHGALNLGHSLNTSAWIEKGKKSGGLRTQ